jgi:beta-lactamase regulating signal transducer with metallopeptidase domain
MSGFAGFLNVLGWSLLNGIWQMALMWLAYYMLTAGNKRISPAGKHNLAIMFVAMGTGWFFNGLLNTSPHPVLPDFFILPKFTDYWISGLAGIYLFILAMRSVQYGLQSLKKHQTESGRSVSAVLQTFADRHVKLMGITREVRVYLSDLAETAQTSGFLKPFILLPVSLVTRLTPTQVEAILVHELFHIRRNDYLFNMLMSCFRNLFFFNPFAQLFYKAVEQERELACDDGVLEMHYPPALYAEALFCLEKFRQVRPGFSIAADGNRPWFLMERIRRVLGRPERHKRKSNPVWLVSLVFAFAFFGLQRKPANRPAAMPPSSLQKPITITVGGPVTTERKYSVRKMEVSPIPQHKAFRKLSMRILPVDVAVVEPPEEPDPPENVSFADQNIKRDFSNQQTAGTVRKALRVYPGAPYVPSVSLSYEEVPGTITADSIRELVVRNGMKEMMTAYRQNTAARLQQLEKSLEKNNALLKNMEIKNQPPILLRDKNDKKRLDNLQKQVEKTKLEIDQLQMQLQISDEEIIRI